MANLRAGRYRCLHLTQLLKQYPHFLDFPFSTYCFGQPLPKRFSSIIHSFDVGRNWLSRKMVETYPCKSQYFWLLKQCRFTADDLVKTLCMNDLALVSMMKELVWKFIAQFEEVWIRIICNEVSLPSIFLQSCKSCKLWSTAAGRTKQPDSDDGVIHIFNVFSVKEAVEVKVSLFCHSFWFSDSSHETFFWWVLSWTHSLDSWVFF